jgi:hypothetical protein
LNRVEKEPSHGNVTNKWRKCDNLVTIQTVDKSSQERHVTVFGLPRGSENNARVVLNVITENKTQRIKKMRHMIITTGLAALLACSVQAQFSAGKLAVLRAGDNGTNQLSTASPSDLAGAHQSPTFIDEYDPVIPINISTTNTGTNGPVFSVAIPTNDPGAMWFNGHAGSEGYLSQSGDGGTLSFSGYGGNILAQPGTPSDLNIPRGICVIDVSGNNYLPYEGPDWYGLGAGVQTNPRGVVSDNGTNNFFGSGSLDGTEWFNPVLQAPPVTVQNLNSSRQVKIINGVFYTSLQEGDGGGQYPQGIYNLTVEGGGFPVALPEGDAFFLNLVIPAAAQFQSVDGFDINPQRNVAYLADDTYGIQKYGETNGNWQLLCAFAMTNHLDVTPPDFSGFPVGYAGCFGLVVDWSGSHPVVFATTTEETGSFANSNRLVRLDDNFNYTDGEVHDVSANIVTLATAWSTNIAFRGLAWTPDRAPVITTNPVSQSVVLGTPVTFTVAATDNFTNYYEWLVDGVQDPTQTNDSYSVAAAVANSSYQVIVSNAYGAVTSTVANLTVTPGAVPPSLTSPVPALNLINAVDDPVTITVTAAGTTPLSYAWYQSTSPGLTTPLSDGGDFAGAASATLGIHISSLADAGSYYVVVNNGTHEPSSNLVATLAIVSPLPVIFVQPFNTVVASNGTAAFTVSAYPLGNNVSFQWYQGGVAMSDIGGHWSGSQTSSLTDLDAQGNDANTYYVVVTDAGGSVTSTVVSLIIATPAPYSVLPYTSLGAVYQQNFDALPDPGTVSVNNSTTAPPPGTQVPATIPAAGSNAVTYNVSNPFDFAAPLVVPGDVGFGGLNLPSMVGWYSSDLGNEQIQATSGDQTTGLIVSFGCLKATNTVNPLYPTNNRALGIISSPATSGLDVTGAAADGIFALRIKNVAGQTLTNINLSYVSELWRNTLASNLMTNWYYVDPLGTNLTPTNNWTGGFTNIQFGTNLGGTSATLTKIYGTNQPIATTNMSFVNVPLATPWPQGGVLWLVWEETTTVSGGQGFGIDNLVFSSGPPTLWITQTNVSGVPSVTLAWPQMFTSYTLLSTAQIGPANWQPVGQTPTVYEGINYVTLPINPGQQFFSLGN